MSMMNAIDPHRLARYRAMADSARREANRTAGDARDSYLFIAEQWERLAELARQPGTPTSSFG
jgi:hypothetical protein